MSATLSKRQTSAQDTECSRSDQDGDHLLSRWVNGGSPESSSCLGCQNYRMYCRHAHSVIATESISRGENQSSRLGRPDQSLVNGLPKVSIARIARFITDPSLPESWKGSFDRVVSIEMLEAVG